MNKEINRKGQNGVQNRNSNSMPINQRNSVNQANRQQPIGQSSQNKANRMGPHGQTTAMDAQRQSPPSQEAILQANRQRAAMKSAAAKPKSKINNKMIIGLSIGAIAIAGIVIGVPIGLTVSNQQKIFQENNDIIANVGFTKDYEKFLIEYGIGTFANKDAIQTFVNSKNNNWSKWVTPINGNGSAINETNALVVESITVVDKTTGEGESAKTTYELNFKLTSEQYTIDDDLKDGYIVDINPSIQWNVNFLLQIQDLLKNNYASTDNDDVIKVDLQSNKQKQIINMLDKPELVDRVEIVELTTHLNSDSTRVILIHFQFYMKDLSKFSMFKESSVSQESSSMVISWLKRN